MFTRTHRQLLAPMVSLTSSENDVPHEKKSKKSRAASSPHIKWGFVEGWTTARGLQYIQTRSLHIFANVKFMLINLHLSVFVNQLVWCETTKSKFDNRHWCFGSTSHYANWQLLASCMCSCHSNNGYQKLEGNTLPFTQIPLCVFIWCLRFVSQIIPKTSLEYLRWYLRNLWSLLWKMFSPEERKLTLLLILVSNKNGKISFFSSLSLFDERCVTI